MKIGFEIHQQLDTKKLFCKSPSVLREEEAEYEVRRRLRPTQSELGVVDEAAMKEFLKGKSFVYKGYSDSICLVELDEEPPRGPNEEAVEIALTMALLLNAEIVDEIHFMRKVVIDGSNTSGFQRTAIIAFDGHLDTDEGRIGIPTICLEEEAARKLSEDEHTTTYNLDRLGIPLVEITTAPDIKSPGQARDAALKVGELLRATGRVKRGLGTIRQDINVSVDGGARVEIKGVQELNTIPRLIENEVTRQRGLIEVKEKLFERGIKKKAFESDIHDVTSVFKDTDSKVIKGQIKKGRVLAVKLTGFAGLLGGGLLGREIARYVKIHSGLRGIFHSDELPAYGITATEVESVKKAIGLTGDDAFVLVAERESRARRAVDVVVERAKHALKGPLEETRMARDSKSEYMRPLPGSARMYPETDILPYVVSAEHIKKLKDNLPKTYDELANRLVRDYKLGEEMSRQLARSPTVFSVFEKTASKLKNLSTTGVASICLDWKKELDSGSVSSEDLRLFILAADSGEVAKEASSQVREEIKRGKSVKQAIADGRGETVDIESIIEKIILEKTDFIKTNGVHALKPLMGLVMKEARGKVDGKTVNEVLKRKLKELLGE
jgi:glutamyl-tRNA(Gln) amidotransferase subunit E